MNMAALANDYKVPRDDRPPGRMRTSKAVRREHNDGHTTGTARGAVGTHAACGGGVRVRGQAR